ncbi:MAG: hypothetical protein LBQ31_03815 [Bacteroidales bacterium]|jgi:hypothetical protein|nr:hypothetical protein [Bacteroidales bacterium]
MPQSKNKTVLFDIEKALKPYIIADALPVVVKWIEAHPVHLAFSERHGHALGYYMHPRAHPKKHADTRPYISLQIHLNPYLLFFVFVHEWAHLLVHERFPQAKPHAKEWKAIFTNLMQPFLKPEIFPPDLLSAIVHYFRKPTAAIYPNLLNTFHRYGKTRSDYITVYIAHQKQGIILPSPRTK